MSANQLYLLADHIKLSLLERQRAQSLNLPNIDQQDTRITQSLEQFKSGLDALDKENTRLRDSGDAESAGASADSLATLRKQYDDLTSQFHGFSSPSTQDALARPNDPLLNPGFAHSQSGAPSPNARKPSLRVPSAGSATGPSDPKTVRFSDRPDSSSTTPEADLYARYRDDPSSDQPGPSPGYADATEGMSNPEIHDHHQQIMREQDEQLDALGATIGRQRELGTMIGDELDTHVRMLDTLDTTVERHQSRLGQARRGIGKVARGVGESKQMMTIVVLIIILILLIAITK